MNPITPKTIVCFGDSNTHGYNSSTDGRFSPMERWTCLLNQYLGEDYIIIEEGLSGRTAAFDDPLYEGLSGLSYIFPCLMSHEPIDLLIIMLGTNDVKSRFHATPENITKGLERLIQKAMTTPAWNSSPNILLICPAAIDPQYEETPVAGEMGPGCAEKSQALSLLYQALADRLGIHFLDAGSIDGISMFPYDHMHLSLKSHDILARTLAQTIPPLCK